MCGVTFTYGKLHAKYDRESDLGGELGLCVASNLAEVFEKPFFFTEKHM